MLNRLITILTVFLACTTLYSQAQDCQQQKNLRQAAYSVIANPGETASCSIRINWHTDLGSGDSYCFYTRSSDKDWKEVKRAKAQQELCTVYDSIFSQRASGEDFYEEARFLRNTVELDKLKPGTEYMYRVGPNNEGTIRYFKTAPESGQWTAAVISDFHAYTPLPKRVEAAMAMLGTLERCNGGDLDWILHGGDICAWGGSYSFWRDLYSQPYFAKYMWAGVNGNHDNMSRKYLRLSNQFFRYANNNPDNSYAGEEGVCYHFTYANTLFIMLNSESMRSDEGLDKAQQWVRKVIRENPARFIVVVEHYQWFLARNGHTSQYARWCQLFDECGVDLAIGANNHIYARTNALYQGKETDGSKGTVYVQTPSSDNERGQELQEWTENKDLIKFRWAEGGQTVGALLLKGSDRRLEITLYDRNGKALDCVSVLAKK